MATTRSTMARMRRDPDTKQLLPNGHFYVSKDLLPIDPATRSDMSGFTGNWWLGLTLLHTLFTLEHNTICDHLKGEYPHWTDERVFNTAPAGECPR